MYPFLILAAWDTDAGEGNGGQAAHCRKSSRQSTPRKTSCWFHLTTLSTLVRVQRVPFWLLLQQPHKNKLAHALCNWFPACNIVISGPSVSKRAGSQASDGSDLDQSFQDDQESIHCFPSVLFFNCRLLLTSLTCRSISSSLFLQNRGLPVRFLFDYFLRS